MNQDENGLSTKAEALAQAAVAIIAKCLNELRSADTLAAFQPETLLSQVADLTRQAHELNNNSVTENRQQIPLDSMRQVLVFQIFVPLFEALFCAYQILDCIPEPPVIQGTKPKPPLGMLSLKNYTDVACAMECAVALGILPHLEPNVLLAVPERLRYTLPKSLAGRLPRQLLLKSTTIVEQGNHVTELDVVAQAIGHLILLDRFQPMLLPRHVTDLYAALLQANHDSPETARGLPWVQKSPVPTLLQAKTFQTLLLFGTKGPVWLRQAVSVYLTDLAVHDLSAIVQVFVMPDVNSSAAAIRLAKNTPIFFLPVAAKLFLLTHLENQDPAKAQAIVHTVWAIIDVIPIDCLKRSLNLDVTSSVLLAQIQILFSSIPPSSDPSRVIELLWDASGEGPSIWSLWWRLAAHSQVLHVPAIEKAKRLLRILTVAWLQQDKANVPRKYDIMAIRLLQALLPIPWDENNRFRVDQENIRIEKEQSEKAADLSETARSIEARTRVMIQTVLQSEDGEVRRLVSHFFVFMLKLYFSSAGVHGSSLRLVALVALPILCEELSLEPLLSNDEQKGIFEMMKLVFVCMTSYFNGGKETGSQLLFNPDEDQSIQDLRIIGVDVSEFSTEPTDEAGAEVLCSVGSLLLSMLVSILELGADERSVTDETALQSFIEPLQVFSGVTSNDDGLSASSEIAGIGEMSSHAVALLASRKVPASRANSTIQSSGDQVTQAEEDLRSSEPPLRARGVVTLRHLAGDVNTSKDRTKLFKVLNLAVSALADKESYVYLAAIHTLAAIADTAPSIVIPVMGRVVGSGMLDQEMLSEEQRIKLAEALISVIRRKAAMDEYATFLMECMLWGTPGNAATELSDAKTIQQQTHEYFIGPEDDGEEEEASKIEEQSVRLQTGGPLFQTEESDALRSSFLQIVAELWGFVRSDAYTTIVMDACRLSISLEAGRPVRRAGALLARQMYSRLFERGDLDEARAMIAANEEALHAALLRCYTLEDLGDLETQRLYDPATKARCREALDLRQEASELLDAGKLAWSVQMQEDSNPIVHLLRETSTAKKIPGQFLIKELD